VQLDAIDIHFQAETSTKVKPLAGKVNLRNMRAMGEKESLK